MCVCVCESRALIDGWMENLADIFEKPFSVLRLVKFIEIRN